MPVHKICFTHTASFDEPLNVGDALRWVGPQIWRVEKIDGDRVNVELWPDDEPYPELIREFGPGEWPVSDTPA